MIADLNPYPAMKDSGIEWLGEMPEHWELLPPKRALRSESSGASIIKNTAPSEPVQGYVPAFSASGQDVWLPVASHYGDALILSAVGARCGKTFRASGEWGVVANTHVLRPQKDQNLDFWWYVTNSQDWWDRAGAAQPFVRVSATLNRVWVFPPLPEQNAIVRYLDYVDRRVRRLVQAKRKLVTLLTEQKQAIIHHAVTRGLDPDVPMKDSGVEWLGEVPEHWKVRRMKTVARLIMGQSPASEDCSDKPIGIPFLQGCAEFGPRHPQPVQYCHAPSKISPVNAILISVRAPVGRLNVADQEYGIGRGLCAIIPDANSLSAAFARYELEVTGHGFAMASTGSTYDAVSIGDVGVQPMLLPPLSEQAAIVEYLDKTTAEIDAAIARAGREVELLDEYRARLVADVVTGKLDVRDAVAGLPEVDPLEASDPERPT